MQFRLMVKEQGEEEKSPSDMMIKKMELYGDDAKGSSTCSTVSWRV